MTVTGRDRITLQDVESVLPLKSWWAMVAVLPVVRFLTLLTVNHTRLTPNCLTVTAIVLRVMTAVCFCSSDHRWLIAGAAFYYWAYVLDCMDGAVARLRKMSSEFGRFLDHIGDLGGDFLILALLASAQGILVSPMVIAMLFMHLSECYINYLAGNLCRGDSPVRSSFVLFNLYNSYRDWWFRRNSKSFFSFPDYTALIFVVFPLFNRLEEGLEIGFIFLILISLYTIFSTFVSLHTGRRQFP